jgi:AcrR family transcriptional regulator
MARRAAPDTRERVLDTAATLFYEHGVRAVGMQQIIDAAGRATGYLRDTRARIDALVAELGPARPDVLADRIWVVEGLYTAAAHPGGAHAADAAVSLVEDLIAAA